MPAGLREPPPPPAPDDGEEHVDLSDEMGEADFFIEQGLLDEARETLENLRTFYPGHPEVESRLAGLERRLAAAQAPAQPVVADGAFDIGKELAAELDGDQLPAPEEFQYSVEEVFTQFKKGVAQTVRAEDTDTHYDLGIAYKEMGLLDDALQEFETALLGATRRKEVDCLSMIALCRTEKGDAAGAAQAWRRALRSDHLTPDAARAIHYELAMAYRDQGDAESALWYLQKVVRADRAFRDAVAQLAALGGGAGRPPPDAEAQPARGGPKKNIGYV
jgi:tetratricopeptide (TPR) repeat protein